ncbi:oxidoreductase [Mycena metata]|uniref:Oxidoreductase n=1 Tax=Mycena metata TaxID=1033252 RepID=A0AAD7MNS9_9AGAR|nr:oxidoreductase [Mycena metata]KAJ7726807.1 oxidoreductase [Mycena metata]KAJ7726965.1 oxidoreductase [Mycena metata]
MKFDSSQVPDLSDKVFLVTGGTGGIGKETILALAKHNPQGLYFTGRNSQRGAEIVADINASAPSITVAFLECDLESLESVKHAAEQFVSQSDRLDVLVCNAGVMNAPPTLTKEGYEVHFGVNHLAHALFIKLLLPTLLRAAELPNGDARIVSLTSQGYAMHPWGGILFNKLHVPQGASSLLYLANLLYAAELARRYPQITAVAIHPGVVSTELVKTQSFLARAMIPFSRLTPQQGAYNTLWASTSDKEKIVNGGFYEPVGVPGRKLRQSCDDKLAAQLWEWTEKELEGWHL